VQSLTFSQGQKTHDSGPHFHQQLVKRSNPVQYNDEADRSQVVSLTPRTGQNSRFLSCPHRATCLSGCPLRPCPWFLYLFLFTVNGMEEVDVYLLMRGLRRRFLHLSLVRLFLIVLLLNRVLRAPGRRCDAPPSLFSLRSEL